MRLRLPAPARAAVDLQRRLPRPGGAVFEGGHAALAGGIHGPAG
jgi:hypothetical protein